MATLKETADFFGISFQALSEYTKKHLEEINFDGKHAVIQKGKWDFDEVAIRRLAEMRKERPSADLLSLDDFNSLRLEVAEIRKEIVELQNNLTALNKKIAKISKSSDSGFFWVIGVLLIVLAAAFVFFKFRGIFSSLNEPTNVFLNFVFS